MDSTIKPETQERMRALCRKISSNGWELYARMEERLLAYMSGKEPLSEEDAYVLVREHFGDPKMVKSLMQNAHGAAVQATLMRRLAAAVVATQIAGFLKDGLHYLSWRFLEVPHAVGQPGIFALSASLAVLSVVLLWWILRRWQTRLDAGHDVWFTRWHALIVLGIVFAAMALRSTRAPNLVWIAILEHAPTSSSAWTMLLLRWVIVLAAEVLIWLWWCDHAPRRVIAVVAAAGTWVLMQGAMCFFWFHLRLLEAIPTIRLEPSYVTQRSLATLCFAAFFASALLVTYAGARYAKSAIQILRLRAE